MTLSDVALPLQDATERWEAAETFLMDEDLFRAFYERTARSLWAYLARTTSDARLADDLLQETYYRFLRSTETFQDEAHRRNYLFRIATNVVRDVRRRRHTDVMHGRGEVDTAALVSTEDVAARATRRIDVRRALARLKPRERDLLWLAYANGSTHEEIARSLGLRVSSIKMLLFRARQRLIALLQRGRA